MVAFWGTSRTSRLSFVVDFHTQPWAKCKLLHQLTLKPTGNTDNVHPAHGGKTQVRARDISRHELRVTLRVRAQVARAGESWIRHGLRREPTPTARLHCCMREQRFPLDWRTSTMLPHPHARHSLPRNYTTTHVIPSTSECAYWPPTAKEGSLREALATSVVQGDRELPRGASRHSGALADLGRGAAVEANLAGAAPSIL